MIRLPILLLTCISIIKLAFTCTVKDVQDPHEWPCEGIRGTCGCANDCDTVRGNFLNHEKCPRQSNEIACCAPYVSCNGDKYEQATYLVHVNEQECHNFGNDSENYLTREDYDASMDFYNKYGTYLKCGFTCGGISVQRGYKLREAFTKCNDLHNDAVMFVKNCYDRDPKQFFMDSNKIFKTEYCKNCDHLPQPAFAICCDLWVHLTPNSVNAILANVGSYKPGDDAKEYARDIVKAYRRSANGLGSMHMRAVNNDNYINFYNCINDAPGDWLPPNINELKPADNLLPFAPVPIVPNERRPEFKPQPLPLQPVSPTLAKPEVGLLCQTFKTIGMCAIAKVYMLKKCPGAC